MAVLGNIDDDGLLPAEQEVAEGGSEDHRQAEPRVVRHEDQHQQEAQRHLQDVQKRLEQVHQRQHRRLYDTIGILVQHTAAGAAASSATASAAHQHVQSFGRTAPTPVITIGGRSGGGHTISIALLRHRNRSILERVVGPPEQVLPVVLETLVQSGHHEDDQHRPKQAADTVDFPLLEQDRFVVATVERHRHHMVHHRVRAATTACAHRGPVMAVSRVRTVLHHRVIVCTVIDHAVAGVSPRTAARHVPVPTVVVVFRVVHVLLTTTRYVCLSVRACESVCVYSGSG